MAEDATPKHKLAALVQELRGKTSQRRFAKIVGVSNQTISLWEQARMWPDDENLKKLAELKGWTFEELLVHLEGDPIGEVAYKDLERVPSLQQIMAIIRMGKPNCHISPNLSNSSNQATPINTLPCVLKGHSPNVTSFYGRESELALLKQVITEKHCVVLVGPLGIGKTALAAKLLQDIKINQQPQLDCLIWKSIHYTPSVDSLLTDLLYSLNEVIDLVPIDKLARIENLQDKTTLLIEILKVRRCLLVLDAAEAILKRNGESPNPYGDHTGYEQFFRRLVEEEHKSCLLLTSRESFVDLEDLKLKGQPVQLIDINGLGEEALQIFADKGLIDQHRWGELNYKYRGNPLALQLVANIIQDFSSGSVEKFLKWQTTWIGDVFQVDLSKQIGNNQSLTETEKKVLFYLAEELDKGYQSIAFVQLLSDLKSKELIGSVSVSDLVTAVNHLSRKSLIEKSNKTSGELCLSLEPMIKKYILKEHKGYDKSLTNISS